MSLNILFRNSDLLVIDKPSGQSIHNAEDASNLLKQVKAELKIPEPHPVHRLDKETSGVQILALNAETARKLAERFQSRDVTKHYAGLLRGRVEEAEGAWTDPLTDKAEGRRQPAGLARERVPCETRFRTVASSRYFTYVEFDLLTGRQHQIRKHCALHRHALVGDPRYGDPAYNRKMHELYGIDRLLLHCARIEIDGLVFTSPSPAKWQALCAPV